MPFYRMIVADLDGTLRSERKPASPRVVRAVNLAQAAGVRVVVATGRMFLTARPLAEQLGLKDAVICDQGAKARDLESGRNLFEWRLPELLLFELIEYAQQNNYRFVVCADEEFFAPVITAETLAFVGGFQDHLHAPVDWGDVVMRGVSKLTFVNEPETIARILHELRPRYGDRLQVVQSHTRYIEVTHPKGSKGNAAAFLAARWGIGREQVMAIGDQENDLSMIEWAGLGVAMGNAIPELKRAARYVAPAVEQDGAAQAIEKWVLNAVPVTE